MDKDGNQHQLDLGGGTKPPQPMVRVGTKQQPLENGNQPRLQQQLGHGGGTKLPPQLGHGGGTKPPQPVGMVGTKQQPLENSNQSLLQHQQRPQSDLTCIIEKLI